MRSLPTHARRFGTGAAILMLAAAAQATELLVPAYFYPSYDPAQSLWPTMEAALSQGVKVTAIMNVNNGPGSAFNADYKAAIDHFRAAGGTVLGYVYTCYGSNQCSSAVPSTRSVDEVLADAQRYANWYSVDGIFFDEVANGVASLPFYLAVTSAVRAQQPQWRLFGNPGTATDQPYSQLFDTLVTFEQGTGSYAQAVTQPWMLSADPAGQAHLHYNVDTVAAMQQLLTQAQARHAGYVYITDDRYTPGSTVDTNPFDQLPSYWQAEVAAVAAGNAAAVPEPSTMAPWAARAVAALGKPHAVGTSSPAR
jgi:Spherulation-specific family 4